MRSPHFLAISCGASHLCSVHLKMSSSGRCEVCDFQVSPIDFTSSDPLLWLKAASGHFEAIALRFKADLPAGFAIPGHVALSKYLKIPQSSSGKKERTIAFEARQNIPYPFEEVTWGYCVVEQDDLDFDVLIGAARTEVVEALRRYSEEARLSMQTIQPSTTGLVNGFRFNYPELEGCSLLVSVGSKSTELVYIDKRRFHSRSIPFGGQSLSVDIAESLGRPVAEGERVKLAAIAGADIDGSERLAFQSASRSFTARLLAEIARTGAVIQRQGFSFASTRCFVTGGGSVLPGLESELSRTLKLETAAFDPLRKLQITNDALRERLQPWAPFLSDAIGLGLGRFLPDAANVDLTPRSLVWQRRFRRQQPFYLIAGLVACSAVGLSIFNAALEMRTYRQEMENLEVQIRPLSRLNQDIYSRLDQINKVKEVIEKAHVAVEARSSWVSLLNDLQGRLIAVEDVWLDQLKLVRPDEARPPARGQARVAQQETNLKLHLEGRLIDVKNPLTSVSSDSYERVRMLLESFRGSSYVTSLENERFDYSMPGILRFDFTLIINPEVRL